MSEPTNEQLQQFMREVMNIERRYGAELKNAKTNRLNDVREHLEKFATKELDNETPQGKVR